LVDDIIPRNICCRAGYGRKVRVAVVAVLVRYDIIAHAGIRSFLKSEIDALDRISVEIQYPCADCWCIATDDQLSRRVHWVAIEILREGSARAVYLLLNDPHHHHPCGARHEGDLFRAGLDGVKINLSLAIRIGDGKGDTRRRIFGCENAAGVPGVAPEVKWSIWQRPVVLIEDSDQSTTGCSVAVVLLLKHDGRAEWRNSDPSRKRRRKHRPCKNEIVEHRVSFAVDRNGIRSGHR